MGHLTHNLPENNIVSVAEGHDMVIAMGIVTVSMCCSLCGSVLCLSMACDGDQMCSNVAAFYDYSMLHT